MPAVGPAFQRQELDLASISAKYPHAAFFLSKRPHALAVLCAQTDLYRLMFYEEATPDQIERVFQQAKAAGYVVCADTMLLDFTHFTGSIDWDYIKTQSSLTPGLAGYPRKAAYVVGNIHAKQTLAAMLHWRRHIACRAFLDVAEAELWLGQE